MSAQVIPINSAAERDMQQCYLLARAAITLDAAATALTVAQQAVKLSAAAMDVPWSTEREAETERAIGLLRALSREISDAIA